jgi:hypothetical protein
MIGLLNLPIKMKIFPKKSMLSTLKKIMSQKFVRQNLQARPKTFKKILKHQIKFFSHFDEFVWLSPLKIINLLEIEKKIVVFG